MIRYFITAGFFLLIVSAVTAQDILQWRGPKRDGIFPEQGLLHIWPDTGPTLLWHYDELGPGHSSAAIHGDWIFTTGVINNIGHIFSFSMDGKLRWKLPYGEEWMESWPGVRSTPQISDGKLYMFSGQGKLFCRKADDGAFVWSIDVIAEYGGVNLKWGYTENLMIDGDKVFCTVGGPIHNVIAVNKHTGKLIWSCKGKGDISAYGSPALITLSGRKVLVTQTAEHILGIDASTGVLLWSHEQTNKYSVHANSPLFHDGMLFVSSGYGTGGVMLQLSPDGSSVKEVWRNTAMDNRMGGFVLLNGKLYGSDDSNKSWYCLDWKTGTTLGSAKPTGRGTIISADGMLYCYSDKGEMVLALPTSNGMTRVSGFSVPYGDGPHWAHPVIHNGRLYVRHETSLMVYHIKK